MRKPRLETLLEAGLLASRTESYASPPQAMTPEYLDGPSGARLAYRRIAGRTPTVVWLCGFRSDMLGAKTEILSDWATRTGRSFVRSDYSGHGESEGRFEDGTIGAWLADALAVIDALTQGELVLVGSSMGGWMACLAALARPGRVKALVLVAPAADFTAALLEAEMGAVAQDEMARNGVWMRRSDYGDPYPITRALIEEGRRWSILPRPGESPIAISCPVRILQGGQDAVVPWRHALALSQALASTDSVFSVIKDGDHRLSRPQDMARLIATVEDVV